MTSLRCKRCGRALKNPKSVINGMGPICARKAAYYVVRTERKSNYEIVEQSLTKVVIRDIGPWDKFMTVTNNAEGVVSELVESGRLKNGMRLFYYDSENKLDELLVENGRFAGFKYAGNVALATI